MYVPSYQMHNVLNVYSKQLRHNMTSEQKTQTPERPAADRVSLTVEERRQATIEKVSKDIIDKITRCGSLTETRGRITQPARGDSEKAALSGKAQIAEFVFNAIDSINNKQTNTLSVEDSSFLIHRLEQLAKEAGGKKTESWS
jgi:hypothetical protein